MNGKHSIILLLGFVFLVYLWSGNKFQTTNPPRSAEDCMLACGYGRVEKVTSNGDCICKRGK